MLHELAAVVVVETPLAKVDLVEAVMVVQHQT
jgi:hypothetical protein